MIIDTHCHFLPRHFLEGLSSDGFSIVNDGGSEFLHHGNRLLGPLMPRMNDLSVLIEDTERQGFDIRALCTGSWLFCYWAEPAVGARFSRSYNETIAGIAADHAQFAALGTVPLQDIDLAIAELRHGVEELGFKGFAVCTNVNGVYFDHPRFAPFFEAAQDLDVTLFMHPDNVAGVERLDDYRLVQMIGNPHEAALSLVRIICGGVLDRYPRLKLCAVQAGGSIAYLIGRIDHTWNVHEEASRNIPEQPPSAYLERVYYDSITYVPLPLETLLAHVPPTQIVVGSDYPWHMGEPVAAQSVLALEGIDDATRELMLSGNAARLLGL